MELADRYRYIVIEGEFASISVEPQLRITEYLAFASRMLLAFGIVFELPVLTFFFARIGIVTAAPLSAGAAVDIAWWPAAAFALCAALLVRSAWSR